MYQGRLGVSKPEAEALAMWAVQVRLSAYLEKQSCLSILQPYKAAIPPALAEVTAEGSAQLS